MRKIIDAHIHLDKYKDTDIPEVISDVAALISVSMDIQSCKKNLELSKQYPNVSVAFGYHPEQRLPSEENLLEQLSWIEEHKDMCVAIGEVGLPFYLRKDNKLQQPYERYIESLEAFIILAKNLNKPIALHAVYDDAHIVCDLLEKHTIMKAHFHWLKGDQNIIDRIIKNKYKVSFTPDLIYKPKIQKLAHQFPLDLIMVETDGPWSFDGLFNGKQTRPAMIHHIIEELSKIKGLPADEVYQKIYANTQNFYVVKACRN